MAFNTHGVEYTGRVWNTQGLEHKEWDTGSETQMEWKTHGVENTWSGTSRDVHTSKTRAAYSVHGGRAASSSGVWHRLLRTAYIENKKRCSLDMYIPRHSAVDHNVKVGMKSPSTMLYHG